jgi:hypothetical protein
MKYSILTGNRRRQVVDVTRDLEAEGLLEVLLVVHPYNHIVNSVIVGRVRVRAEIKPEPAL